jgi:pimeloyl-ACP methyl ester carboxylesterase
MQVIINNKAVAYEKVGTGPALLMVHGWGDSKKTYRQLITELAPTFTCYSIDLPNFGDSEQNDQTTTIYDYAVFLKQFTDKLAIHEYGTIGHSMGGQILIYAIAEGLLDPERSIYIGAAGVRTEQATRKKALKFAAAIGKNLLSKKTKNKIYSAIGSDYSHDLSPLHKKIIRNVLEFDVQASAKKNQKPSLFIYGSQDVHTPPNFGEIFATNMQNAALDIIDGADHWVHQAQAPVVAHKIKEFMK